MSTITITPEVNDLKARLKDTWMAGDYDRFSRYMEQGARIFYEQLDVPAGYYGPTNRAFASLDGTDAKKLRADLEALWSAHNRGGAELTVVSSEYLEVIAVKA